MTLKISGNKTHSLKSPLSALAFGERSMHIDNSVDDMREKLKYIVTGLVEYESLIDDNLFRHHSSLLTMNDMKIAATASTPIKSKVGKSNKLTLIIPLAGQGNLVANGSNLKWQAGEKAVFLPNCEGSSESSNRSILMVDLDYNKLDSIARNMLAISSSENVPLNLHIPRELNLQIGRVSFETVFRQLASMLDQFSIQPELLNQSGIEDSFYRNIAVMLQPELFLDSSTSSLTRAYARRLLDRVCQYIQAHIKQPITLSDLERVSCMSRRKLHYTFLNRYNCTPMQWVRSERLLLVHNKLNRAIPGDKVTTISLEYGFTKPATFAIYYQKQFGELPSVTLARSLRR
jgi:AraC-like DNA-binding protein